MVPLKWVFMTFLPLVLIFGLGVAHRVPPAPKAMEGAADQADFGFGGPVGAEIIGGDNGEAGMSFGMGGDIWGGSCSEPEHGESNRMVFSGSSSFGSAGNGKPSHGHGMDASPGDGDSGRGFNGLGSMDLQWANE